MNLYRRLKPRMVKCLRSLKTQYVNRRRKEAVCGSGSKKRNYQVSDSSIKVKADIGSQDSSFTIVIDLP